jgi:alkylation response protein AidB-like acyl-CoA dehydrogenase
MDLSLSPSEREFRDEVRAWLEENHPGPEPEGGLEEVMAFRREWQGKLHEAGWAGISWPKEYGGRGATLIEQAIFVGEAARQEAPSPANVLGLAMGGPVVIAHGTDEQKQRYLEPILTAEEILVPGLLRARVGLRPRLAEDPRGQGRRRMGRHRPEGVDDPRPVREVVHARRPHRPRRSQAQGAHLLPDGHGAGRRGAKPLVQITGEGEFNEVFIEEARVPEANVVGGVGNGWSVAITTLMNERAGLAFGAIAQIANSLKRLARWPRDARQRRHRGRGPVFRQRIAQLHIEAETMRLNAYRGLTKTMQSGIPGPRARSASGSGPTSTSGSPSWRSTSRAPTRRSPRRRARVADGAWQYGFLRSRANSIEGGTTDILKNIIAERVLGLPRMR